MKKILFSFLLVLFLVAFGTSANAYIILNDWQLDLDGVDGLVGGPLISGIDQITYYGIARGQSQGLFTGALGATDGFLSATGFVINGVTTALPAGVEITFSFSLTSQTTNVINLGPGGLLTTFEHLDPATVNPASTYYRDGILDIYVDNLANGGVQASALTGLGYEDGQKVASFDVIAGDGGVFFSKTFDGSDDGTFALASAMAGVFLDSLGNDLGTGATIAITDSNFDRLSTTPLGTAIWPGLWSHPTPTDFIAEEDGSARIAQTVVPEPATLLLLGLGFLGVGAFSRRKFRK